MTDEELIAELRKPWFTNGCERYQLDAADRIEALVKEMASGSFYKESDIDALQDRIKRLEAALKPFSEAADEADDCGLHDNVQAPVTSEDCRNARTALKGDDHV